MRNSRDELFEGGGGIPPGSCKRDENTRKELHATDTSKWIKDHERKWWEHVERLEDEPFPELVSKYNSASKGGLGTKHILNRQNILHLKTVQAVT
jgi:hypothetical protein